MPHAGRSYPDDIATLLAFSLARARAIEDRYADMLATGAAEAGHCTLIARTPRLLIDLNRAETDFDPLLIEGGQHCARPSHRARGGLGLIPDRLPGVGALWKQRPGKAVLAQRIATVHRPYHAALAECLGAARQGHGHAILIDLHSMPPIAAGYAADIVIGDLRGASAAASVVDAAHRVFERHGLRVARNVPYAGAHILERHGCPASQVHALQIEVDRRLYLDTRLDAPGAGLAAMTAVIADLANTLRQYRPAQDWALAAE